MVKTDVPLLLILVGKAATLTAWPDGVGMGVAVGVAVGVGVGVAIGVGVGVAVGVGVGVADGVGVGVGLVRAP